jgi:hypothetical protein
LLARFFENNVLILGEYDSDLLKKRKIKNVYFLSIKTESPGKSSPAR